MNADRNQSMLREVRSLVYCIRKTETILGLSRRGKFTHRMNYTNEPATEKARRGWWSNPGLSKSKSGKLPSWPGTESRWCPSLGGQVRSYTREETQPLLKNALLN